ncbi:hypothetical protein [Sphingomonas sp.]|uniref:hypothetical protein n=1 Tax=Sphingomonas sp. TaxID=28214 RepID=UPI0025FD6E46|nr:hypothetical protein [Sphingomonas sp.]
MRISYFIPILLMGSSAVAPASRVDAQPGGSWIKDGRRLCTFDDALREVECIQYHQLIEHHLKSGGSWREYRWLWRGPNRAEVRYTSRIGLVGVSNFTIGELIDPHSTLPEHASKNAVSYAPSRDELIIGVPGEGYEFSVKGGT